jgi:protoporphyrinogen oxidase
VTQPAGGQRIVIIGAGLTGLGAGHRLQELGHDDWVILEASDVVGGLAASHTDDAGFTYDIGGHVIFSHYEYYDRLLDRLLGDDHTEIARQAWVHVDGRHLPYPFQDNLRHLDPEVVLECVAGLVAAQSDDSVVHDFAAWVQRTFGAGIARHFMVPYNTKVWATALERMAHGWIAERVQVVDVEAVLRNVILGEDRVPWGPNSTFRYPLRGGTGILAERLAAPLDDHIHRSTAVDTVDPDEREVRTADGRRWPYDTLVSTIALPDLVAMIGSAPAAVQVATGRLRAVGTHVVGLGIDRPAGTDHNWVYYPEPDVPFHRLTYLSNYSPHMTPAPDQTVLLTETSWSDTHPVPEETIVDDVVDGLVRVGVLDEDDRRRIVSTWRCSPARSYPVPTLGRDTALAVVQPWLASQQILSRGRFGAWLYEIGNMDHSTMQGVELADHLLLGDEERTWRPPDPQAADQAGTSSYTQ